MQPGMDDNKRQSTDRESAYVLIEELRQLRKDAQRLNSSMVERLKPFQKKNGSFKTLPQSREKKETARKPDISVASTCTVLMAAILAGQKVHKSLFDVRSISDVFRKSVTDANWGSSGLTDGNAFTTAIVVRSAGFVVNAGIMGGKNVAALKHRRIKDAEGVADKTLAQIVRAKAKNPARSFAVEDYPPKSTHAYWFVDGVISMGVDLGPESWEKIATWASNEFHRQLIYVSAGNDALMDPPSLAMAACVISRIRRFSMTEPRLTAVSRQMPSTVELQFGIEQVFSKQSDSGIWYRYFPLFHFPKGQGAADYCFSFEFLEAILVEFGHSVLKDGELLQRIKRIITWCDTHELVFADSNKEYRGWNSGGEVRKLAAGQSESWATASVHMFLMQLERKINDVLDDLILKSFGFDRAAVVRSANKFDELIDATLKFPGERETTLKTVIQREILNPVRQLDRNPEKLIETGIPVPRSALLFGPPGTSKSRLAKAIAEYLAWPLITITPSEFLGKGLEQVHAQVDARFRDLMDLRRAVVFFDEMDALAQTREADDPPKVAANKEKTTQQPKHESPDLDVTRQLLTTSMLPKLANLWDQKRVVFLMATNHKRQLDPAITRPNRFDLLLCVAPPPWKRKHATGSLSAILGISEGDAQKIEAKLTHLAPDDSPTAKELDHFTIAEVGIFLYHLRKSRQTSLLDALTQFSTPDEFHKLVTGWAKDSITLRTTDSPTRSEFLKDLKESRRQYFPGQR
jgi:hypothetical protein